MNEYYRIFEIDKGGNFFEQFSFNKENFFSKKSAKHALFVEMNKPENKNRQEIIGWNREFVILKVYKEK